MSDTGRGDEGGDGTYGGVFGAFPYAVRATDSRLLQSYVLVGGLAALLVVLLFALGVVAILGSTVGVGGGTLTFSRAFFVFVGFLVVAPLVAPVLFVARRHRRGSHDRRYDARLARAGYLFLASLYVGLIVLVPPELQGTVTGPHAPVVEFLYDLPRSVGLVPPVIVALRMVQLARRSDGGDAAE